MTDVTETLEQRASTHGDYQSQAYTAQILKEVMRDAPKWRDLNSHQRDALEMIAVKISRILNGDPCHVDSWHDIAGYATLVEQILTGGE